MVQVNKVKLVRVNGQGVVDGKVPRKVLERNAMDRLTSGDRDFSECQDFVEEASRQTLIDFLVEYEAAETEAEYEAVIAKYMEVTV